MKPVPPAQVEGAFGLIVLVPFLAAIYLAMYLDYAVFTPLRTAVRHLRLFDQRPHQSSRA
jgi:hypothetical protein